MSQLFRGYEAVKLTRRICSIRSTWNQQGRWNDLEPSIISVLEHIDICYNILFNIKLHMALEGTQGKKNTTKYKPFGCCHKWIIFKTNQLVSYLCTEKINISKCDRQSNRLFRQFSPKVIFIHNRQVCSPVFSTYTWTASYRKWHNTNRCKNTKYLQQKTIILLLKENLVAGGQNFLPRSFAFLSLTFTCLLADPLLSKVMEITKQGKIYWNLAMGCY